MQAIDWNKAIYAVLAICLTVLVALGKIAPSYLLTLATYLLQSPVKPNATPIYNAVPADVPTQPEAGAPLNVHEVKK